MLINIGRTLARITALLLLGTLVSCGGGGGGGGGGGSASGGAGVPAGSSPLVYTGNANPAVITTTNAAELAVNVLGGAAASSIFFSAAAPRATIGARDLGHRLGSALRATPVLPRSSSQSLTSVPVEREEPCDSGSVRTVGDISQNGTGTATTTWNACRTGDTTLNGTGTTKVDAFDLATSTITDGTFTLERLSLSSPAASAEVSGSVRVQLNLAAISQTVTLNLVILESSGGAAKTENFVVVDTFNSLGTSYTESISGRIFDGVLGFVDVLTNSPLAFNSLVQAFPSNGQLVLIGASNARVRLTAQSTTAAEVALDLDGNNIFEIAVRLLWTDLSGPVGADLGDTDNDRMHNGWETAFGLNPSDPADATGDLDLDGATNLEEYQAGTKPNDRTSLPPAPSLPGDPVRVISMPGTIDLVFDSGSQTMFASVRDTPGMPGSVVSINPATGAVGSAIPVGIDPQKLALSGDGRYLYVALDESAVQRIDLTTRRVDLTFSLGASSRCPTPAPLFVQDMQVVPGNPQAIVIARVNTCLSPSHEGVAVYVDGVQRGAVLLDRSEASNVIEFSASAGTLYGLTTEISSLAFRTMTVSVESGVTEFAVFTRFDGDVFPSSTRDMLFAGSRIYLPGGRIIDPQIPTVVGQFPLPFSFETLVRPDPALGRVFFLVDRDGSPVGLPRPWTLLAFDAITRELLDEREIPGVLENAGTLIRWGAKGLAFRTFRQGVFLIQPPASLIP